MSTANKRGDTPRRKREPIAEIGSERLRLVLDHVPALIAYVDATETYQFANRAYETLFGLSPEQMIGRSMRDVLGEKYAEAKPHIDAALAGRRAMHDRRVTANRRSHYLHNVYVPHIGDDGKVEGLFILAVDISDRKALEQELAHKAHHDPLTGLPNRNVFEDSLAQALERGRRSGAALALMYLDIDDFKAINDALGHQAGDTILTAFAARIRKCVRSTDTVGRLGGDEFVVLLENVAHEQDAIAIAGKLVAAMQEPFAVAGATVRATTSIGLSVSTDPNIGASELIARADAALYEAKAAGRNRFKLA